jgi:hypothetical protein
MGEEREEERGTKMKNERIKEGEKNRGRTDKD